LIKIINKKSELIVQHKIKIINTGGTFHKKYNKINGQLEISTHSEELNSTIWKILESTEMNFEFNISAIIFKDSLEMNIKDRKAILHKILSSEEEDILIIHGTDTIDLTAQYLFDHFEQINNKRIILTGAMRPFEIDKIEASLNIGLSLGYFQSDDLKPDIYIAMNGLVKTFEYIKKNRTEGFFE
jgi:L-asparaginase